MSEVNGPGFNQTVKNAVNNAVNNSMELENNKAEELKKEANSIFNAKEKHIPDNVANRPNSINSLPNALDCAKTLLQNMVEFLKSATTLPALKKQDIEKLIQKVAEFIDNTEKEALKEVSEDATTSKEINKEIG